MPIDYNKYPPNWKTEIRPAVLKRADNKCECCFYVKGGNDYLFRAGAISNPKHSPSPSEPPPLLF